MRAQDQRFQTLAGGGHEKRPVAGQKHPAIIALHALRKRTAHQLIAGAVDHPAKRLIDFLNQPDVIEHQVANRGLMKQQGKLVAGLLQFGHDPPQLFILNFQFNLMHLELMNQLAGLLASQIRQFLPAAHRIRFRLFPEQSCSILIILGHVASLSAQNLIFNPRNTSKSQRQIPHSQCI